MSVKITEMIAALNDAITAMQSRVDDRMLLLEANIDSKTKDIDVLKQELANPAINQPDDPATISSLQTLTDSVNNYLPAGG